MADEYASGMVIAGTILAAVLELAGLVLAARGFMQTWRQHAPGQDFWVPYKIGVRRSGRRVKFALMRFLRIPGRDVTILDVASASHAVGSDHVQVAVGWGPLPDPEADPQGFASVLHERLNVLHAGMQENWHALASEQRERKAAVSKLRIELESEAARLEAATHTVAVDGLHGQLVGWFLLLAGILVGMVTSVYSAATR